VLFLGPNHCTMVMYDVNLTGSWVRGNEKALYYFSNFPVSLKLLQNETVQHDILWKVRLLESTIGDKIPPRGSEWGEGWGGNTLISHRSWEFGDRLGSHSPSGCSWGSPLRWSWQLKSLQRHLKDSRSSLPQSELLETPSSIQPVEMCLPLVL
jgi:hypothetical protein